MKNKSNWIRVFFIIFFFGFGFFIFNQKTAFFDPIKNTKNLKQTEIQERKDGYYHSSFDFTAKCEKIRSVELRFDQTVKEKEIELQLQDKNHKKMAVERMTIFKESRVTWSVEKKLNIGDTYRILVCYPKAKGVSLKRVQLRYHTFHTIAFYGALFLNICMICWIVWDWHKKKEYRTKSVRKLRFQSILYLLFNGFFSFWLLEFVFQNEKIFHIQPYYLIHNWIFCTTIYFILLILFNSFKLSIVIGNIFFLIWAIANQFVFLFKGQPIQPIDLFNISTARSVAREYTYTLTWQMMIAILFIMIILWIVIRVGEEKLFLFEKQKRNRYIIFPIAGVLLCISEFMFIKNTDYISNMGIKVHLWRLQDTYDEYGIPMAFLATGKNMQVEEPKEYGDKYFFRLMEEYEKEAKKQSVQSEEEKPNIIVIMNESFADLSYIKPDLKTNLPYLSYYNSMKENTVKGHLLVSPFGGWTANSEYEFLFGHSMEFLGAAIPYSQYLNREHSTLASNLRQMGYDTIAFHPHKPNNWRRASVYPNIGFDQFISRDDITNDNKIRNYISDESDYDELFKLMEEKEPGKRNFIFNVTLQNHGGYTYEKDDFRSEVFIENGQFPEANQYLTLIKKSDEALEKLIHYFENYDEPTLIVFFGDHYPNLPSDFYTWLYGKPERELTLEEIQKKYSVPFFIWANYDIEEEENILISTNYLSTKVMEIAGLPKTPYQLYLTGLEKKIPCVNVNGYVDAAGIHHRLEEKNQNSSLLNEYNMIQYNELFDKKNKVQHFFQIPK